MSFLLQRTVPYVAKKKNMDDWLAYRSDWSSTTIKDCLFAHHNRKEQNIEELRVRAELEVQSKAKAQRRRNRYSALVGNTDIPAARQEDLPNRLQPAHKKARQEGSSSNAAGVTSTIDNSRCSGGNAVIETNVAVPTTVPPTAPRIAAVHTDTSLVNGNAVPAVSVSTATPTTVIVPTSFSTTVSAAVPLDTQVEILKFLTQHGDETFKKDAMRQLLALATQRWALRRSNDAVVQKICGLHWFK